MGDSESDDITGSVVECSFRFVGSKQNIVMTPNQQLTFNRSTNKVDVKEIDTSKIKDEQTRSHPRDV